MNSFIFPGRCQIAGGDRNGGCGELQRRSARLRFGAGYSGFWVIRHGYAALQYAQQQLAAGQAGRDSLPDGLCAQPEGSASRRAGREHQCDNGEQQ